MQKMPKGFFYGTEEVSIIFDLYHKISQKYKITKKVLVKEKLEGKFTGRIMLCERWKCQCYTIMSNVIDG
jgi:hypothetical protein